MKTAIVSSKKLAEGGCWSAKRFTNDCADCIHVLKCKEQEAKIGRVILANQKVRKLNEQLQEAKELLEKCKEEVL